MTQSHVVQAAPYHPEIKVVRTGRKPTPWHWRISVTEHLEHTSVQSYRSAEEAFQAAKARLEQLRPLREMTVNSANAVT